MKVSQAIRNGEKNWEFVQRNSSEKAQLVLIFGDRFDLEDPSVIPELRNLFPVADIISVSSCGNISDINVLDSQMIATAIYFEKAAIRVYGRKLSRYENYFLLGKEISGHLSDPSLKHILVFTGGNSVNGSQLASGLNSLNHVSKSGGMAGDGTRFERTIAGLNSVPDDDCVVAVGIYGDNIEIESGSYGGWDVFGTNRIITKSKGNILYELDNQPALELYKKYLGEKTAELPASALLFPLELENTNPHEKVIRTILAVNHDENSMTFAGDMPEGATVRLMKANFDRLIDGSAKAAQLCFDSFHNHPVDLALLVSCVGRKWVLGPRVEEELESVKKVIGNIPVIAGFYSYGELSSTGGMCSLHNQTMTLTTFREH